MWEGRAAAGGFAVEDAGGEEGGGAGAEGVAGAGAAAAGSAGVAAVAGACFAAEVLEVVGLPYYWALKAAGALRCAGL